MSDSRDSPEARRARERCRSWMGRPGGPNEGTLLTLLFVALKLTGHIDWSWWWVLSPVWITAALLALGLGVVFLFGAFTGRKRKIRPG